jgi:hypothetical protein
VAEADDVRVFVASLLGAAMTLIALAFVAAPMISAALVSTTAIVAGMARCGCTIRGARPLVAGRLSRSRLGRLWSRGLRLLGEILSTRRTFVC